MPPISRAPFTFVPEEPPADGPMSTIRSAHVGAAALSGSASRLGDAYVLDRTLGTGGTAVVRLARQLSLDREVAVKTPLAADSLDGVTRVLQEAWVTGALEHPGVVPIHDVALDAVGVPHIVMRRIEGWTWTELLADPALLQERFGVRDVLGWHLRTLMSVAGTVHHAHRLGVLHRDLKPDNVMIGAAGEAYVLDWGLAVALDERSARYLPRAAEQSGVAGTPRYMAPEMVTPGGGLGVRTDVYLLGGLLHAVLTGDGPHAGDDVEAVLASIPAFVPRFDPEVPARLAALCTLALSPDPDRRPADAEAIRRAVQAWLEERDVDALTDAGDRELAALRGARGMGAGPEAIVRCFGAARASYEQALARAPDSERALHGLAAARREMVDWELERGDPHAAELVIAEMPAPPAELVERVRTACAAVDARAAEAARLLADADPGAGVRTRAFVTVITGLMFVMLPLVAWQYDPNPPIIRLLYAHAILFVAILALWGWARQSLGKSTLNRAFIRQLAAAPLLQMSAVLGGASLGLSAAEVTTLLPLPLAAMCMSAAAALEPWMALAAVGYIAAFLASTADPALRWPALAAANLGLMFVSLGLWGPDGLRSWILFRRTKHQAPPPP